MPTVHCVSRALLNENGLHRLQLGTGEGKLKFTADRITALDAIGFNWRSETTALSASRLKWNFQDHVNNLKAYKTQHGHLNVKHQKIKNFTIGVQTLETLEGILRHIG